MTNVERFNPHVADARWQKIWEERSSFVADDNSTKPRAYVLEMFPYPSGRIHIGHVRNYTMGDVLARYKRMTEMTVVIHRHTADVHPHLARIDGSKRHFVTRKRVVNFERTHEQYGLGNERNQNSCHRRHRDSLRRQGLRTVFDKMGV